MFAWVRRILISLVFISYFAVSLYAYDVAIVVSKNLSNFDQVVAGFVANIKTSYRIFNLSTGENKVYVLLKMDSPKVFFAVGGKALNFVLEKFPSIPAIYAMVLHESEIPSDAYNISGVRNKIPYIEQLNLIKFSIKKINSIGVLYSATTQKDYKELIAAGNRLKVKIIGKKINSPSELTASFLSVISNVDAFWLLFDPLFLNPTFIKYIILKCVEQSKPFIAFSPILVKAGALISVAPDYSGVGVEAAKMVKLILEGVRPDHIPKREPPKAIYINRIIATKLGLTFPPWVEKNAIFFR